MAEERSSNSNSNPPPLDGSFLLQLLHKNPQPTSSSSSSHPLLPHQLLRPYHDPAVAAIGPAFSFLPNHIFPPDEPRLGFPPPGFTPPNSAPLNRRPAHNEQRLNLENDRVRVYREKHDLMDGEVDEQRVRVRTLEELDHVGIGQFGSRNEVSCEEDLLGKQLAAAISDLWPSKEVMDIRNSRGKDVRKDFFRGHRVSSQRVRIRRRELRCRHELNSFGPRFLSIFKSLLPSEDEIIKQEQLLLLLRKLVKREWPDAELHLYGSCANSFGVSNSDIDVCLAINDHEISKHDILLKLADILKSSNLLNVQALTHARVPIVKMMDPVTGISCDICINNLLAVANTKLLKDYGQIDQRLRQLAFIVKHWAKSRRVNETYHGTLSSYAYVLMCIHFLQTRKPAILPCLQGMEATCRVIVDGTECAYFDNVEKLYNFGARNKESITQLLWSFFHYWAYWHDYTNDVISVRTGSFISKQEKDWTRRIGNDRHLICIEDPFLVSHDLGRVVDKFSIKILREEFERAADILQYNPNPTVTLFEPYVPASFPELAPADLVESL